MGKFTGQLTARMKQVLDGMFVGKTNKEIALELGISVKTVEKHRSDLYVSFDVNNAVSLIVTALRAKVISL